ncbi:MAG TPA: F0F1 ATP synthase subunit B [Candidatus Saccharimonadia bacterium]|nr:F0F1 ATP synthase subunit B [Candidatus Saccharimonadia bacterium]
MIIINNLLASSSSASGIAALGFSLPSFLIQLGSFIIVFLILRKYAFKPIIKVLKQRRELIEDGVNLGEQMQKRHRELQEQIEAELHKARLEADKLISDSQSQSRDLIIAAENDAKKRADIIIKDAKTQIEHDTQKARKSLKSELISLVSDATEAIIHEKVDAKKDSELIDHALGRGHKI